MKDELLASQVRAARGLLNWSRSDLAEEAKTTERTVSRLELAEGVVRRSTIAAIRTALESAGVEFIPENGGGAGVRLRKR